MSDETRLIAFLDANVLYPARLRDLLMRLALRDLFQPRWSEQVHDEWTNAALRDHADLTATQLQRVRRLMEQSLCDAAVTDFEHRIESLTLPDPDDRHVLAAAIHGGANVIITANLRDFPADALAPHQIEAVHPDSFVARLLETDAAEVIDAVHELHHNLKKPAMTMDELLSLFERADLVTTVAELRRLMASDQRVDDR